MNETNIMISDGALVTAGDIQEFETAPIYWGMAGTMFRKNAFTFFIRSTSKTARHLLEQNHFTISFYYPRYRQHLSHLSVEAEDARTRIMQINFHTVEVEETVTFKEAYLTYVCKKIYTQKIDPASVEETYRNIYLSSDDSLLMFVGEVVQEIEEENLDK